jgi:hypothetical protein
MILSGINKKELESFGGWVYNFMTDPEVAAEAKEGAVQERLCQWSGQMHLAACDLRTWQRTDSADTAIRAIRGRQAQQAGAYNRRSRRLCKCGGV